MHAPLLVVKLSAGLLKFIEQIPGGVANDGFEIVHEWLHGADGGVGVQEGNVLG